MADVRPFPPSPRRRALARRAGMSSASAAVTATAAAIAAVVVTAQLGPRAAHALGDWLARACRGEAADPGELVRAVWSIAGPILGAAGIAAALAHVAQTRTLWLPRRAVDGAPPPVELRPRMLVASIVGPIAIGAATLAFLWRLAPQAGNATFAAPPAAASYVGAVAISAIGAFVAIAAGLAILDAALARRAFDHALAMTASEHRRDLREAAIDPRFAARRASLARGGVRDALAGASLVIVGDRIAAAIAWHPVARPAPARVAWGRDVHATQLIALARRLALPIHRDDALARTLANGGEAIDRAAWARLAELYAATAK